MVFGDEDWGSNQTVVAYEGDLANLSKSTWTPWEINLQRLIENNPSFRLDQVKK